MKILLLLFLLCTVNLLSQESRTWTLYAEFGYGFSRSYYANATGGYGLQLAITTGYDTWLVKYARRVNNESSFIAPQEKINANSLLIGHSFILSRTYDDHSHLTDEFNLTVYIGYSAIENHGRKKIFNANGVTTTNELAVEHGTGVPIELEIQYILPHFRAVALNVFYNMNEFRDFYGINLMIFVGYF